MITCSRCSNEMTDGSIFCSNCGNKLTEASEPDQPGTLPVPEESAPEPLADKKSATETLSKEICNEQPVSAQTRSNQKLLKKAALFGGIGLAIITIVAAVILLLPDGAKDLVNQLLTKDQRAESKPNYALYFKDKELFFSDLTEESTALQLTSNLIDCDEIDDSHLTSVGWGLHFFTYMSEDGSLMFYPDKVDTNDEGCNLYYRNMKDPEAGPVKIDSDVVSYTVDETAAHVTYIKGDAGNLYHYTISDDTKEKIASGVAEFRASDDGSKIGYMDSEGSIYLQCAGQEKEKIASDVTEVAYLSEDFSTVFYIKDNTLYKQVEGEDRVKLTTDVHSVIEAYDSGEVYYLKEDAETTTLMEYVQDDLKDTDAALVKPTAPAYPYWWEYDTTEAYNAAYTAYEKAYADYNEAYTAYSEKLTRDKLRDELEENAIDSSSYTLCFHDGTEEQVLTETYALYSSHDAATDVPVIAYQAYSQSGFEKVKLSEITSIDNIVTLIDEKRSSSKESYLAIRDSSSLLDQEDAQIFRINASGTLMYYMAELSEDSSYGELYRISIQDGIAGASELYDSEVCYYYGGHYFISDEKLCYFKDVKDAQGDLYIDKTKIDFDVSIQSIDYYADQERLIYFVDWDTEKQYGTLKSYEDGTATKISDDVNSCSVIADGRILYLYDYSLDHQNGELYEWSSGTKRKLDDDVIKIITMTNSKYKGDFYY